MVPSEMQDDNPPKTPEDADDGILQTLRVAIPTMKSIFIQMYFGDTLLSSGTAFLAARTQTGHCALITNRHNVTGRNQETGACLSKSAGTPDTIAIHFHDAQKLTRQWKIVRLPLYKTDGSPWWIEHPRLGATADVVALNLSWGRDVHKMPYYVGGDTTLDQSGMLIDPAEPVSVIGFPFGISLAGKFPVWATGFLAQDLTLVDSEKPVFLIDCRTREGQSGAPVIAYRTSNIRRMNGGRITTSLGEPTTWEFIGIYSGRVNAESDLGRVWHSSIVAELLDAAKAAKDRRTASKSNL